MRKFVKRSASFPKSRRKSRFSMKWKIILGLVILALIVILLVQNTQVVTFSIYFWKISISQVILVPIIMLIGMLLGVLLVKARQKP